jgi:hypothetical protein
MVASVILATSIAAVIAAVPANGTAVGATVSAYRRVPEWAAVRHMSRRAGSDIPVHPGGKLGGHRSPTAGAANLGSPACLLVGRPVPCVRVHYSLRLRV